MAERIAEWTRYRMAAKNRPLLPAGAERTLLEQARAGCPKATRALVESHMRLVVQTASGYARDGLSVHDLMAEGTLGLMEAIRRFDLTRDSRFASYATWWVRACIRRHALCNRRIVGMPDSRGARLARARLRGTERRLTQELGRKPSYRELASALGVSEDDVVLVDTALSSRDVPILLGEVDTFEPRCDSFDPEQAVAEAEAHEKRTRTVQSALDALSERERALVCDHLYREDAKSLAELGRMLGVSRQRAGQILEGARQKLRAELQQVA